jgi:hypothetical protein
VSAPEAAQGLAARLAIHFETGAPDPALAPILSFSPETFALLGFHARGSPARATAAAQAVVEALAEPRPAPGAPDAPVSAPGATSPLGGDVGARDGEPDAPSALPPSASPALAEGLRRAREVLVALDSLEGLLARLSPWEHLGHHPRGSLLERVAADGLGPLQDLLAATPALRRLAELLGAVERSAAGGPSRNAGGRDTVMGVIEGADPPDLLVSERALLADPSTEPLFDLRFVERRLLQIQWAGGEPFGPRAPHRPRPRGPLIALVDTSGSMLGEPLQLARAATLVLVRRALREGRPAHVLLFGGTGAEVGRDFRPQRPDPGALVALLLGAFGGGTELGGPLRAALELRRRSPPFAGADVALVSDGIAALPEKVLADLEAARRAGMRLGALAIVRPGRGVGVLEALADPLEKLETGAFSV